ncbi:MAG TPA: YcxB family protein [Puia sp.]
MRDTFTISHDFSFGEYFNLSLYQMFKTKMIRRLALFAIGIGLLAGLLGLWVPGNNETIKPFNLVGQFFLPLAAMVVLFTLFAFLTCLFIVRFKPHIIRGITYRFTHWGMERIGTKTEATIPWRDFQNLKETRSFFLLFVKETVKENRISNIHVIQKRMFTSPEDTREFQVFLDQNVPL